MFRVIGDCMGISEAVVCRTVHRVCGCIASLAATYIYMPRNINRTNADFFAISGFPNVIGCVDGTFIKIRAPSTNEQDYVNRKGYHSLNVQMTCDANFRITSIVAKWPGSVHDARVFRNSALCRNMENGKYNGILLGDSGYPCTRNLITPYAVACTESHNRFNAALCRTRVRIEQTFGILKRRFICLSEIIRVKPSRATVICVACAVLHNIGIEQGDILNGTFDNQEENEDHPNVVNEDSGERVRNQLRERYFS